MFSRAENIVITGGSFVANETNYPASDSRKEWMKLLRENTSSGAFHNSGERRDAPKCHPQTRVEVNREIMEWVRNKNREQQILWIYGPAGTGKSSIAQSIAELCEEEGSLASDFFFSRTIAGRNTDAKLVSSLACQLTVTIPSIRPHIGAAIDADTLVFSRSLQKQFDTLIIEPINQLVSAPSNLTITMEKPLPYLIIIDGLDECGTPESQLYILSSLASALKKTSSVPLIFVIASRPEQMIRDAFNGFLNAQTRRIVLDNRYEPDADIRLFLESKFSEIKKTHLMAQTLHPDWPVPSDLDFLVQKASGQFIYAATVMKFIGSPRGRPAKALNIILKLSSPGPYTPFADLDSLYKHILFSLEEADLGKALVIFAFLFLTATIRVASTYGSLIYRTPTVIEKFLRYEPGEVAIVMSDLHSIVSVPSWSYSSTYSSTYQFELRLFHASLSDFLQDKARSETLFIDRAMYSAQFSRICLDHLSPWLEHEALPSLDDCSGAIRYSSYIFMEIIIHAHPDEELFQKLRFFPFKTFLQCVFSAEKDPCLKQDILRRIPALFDWIRGQENGFELYNMYKEQYDEHLKLRLLLDLVVHSEWKHVFAALALDYRKDELTKYFWRLCFILDRKDTLGPHLFSMSITFRDKSQPCDYLDYSMSRLIDTITNPKDVDSKKYYRVDRQDYLDLAIELFDCLTIETKRSGNGLDYVDSDWRLPLDLFTTVVLRYPGEPRLGSYLRSNSHRRCHDGIYSLATEFHSLVERYIKDCNLPQEQSPFPQAASRATSNLKNPPMGMIFPLNHPNPSRTLFDLPKNDRLTPVAHQDREPINESDTNKTASTSFFPSIPPPPTPLITAHIRDRPLVSSSFGTRGFGMTQQMGLGTSSAQPRQPGILPSTMVIERLATGNFKGQLDGHPQTTIPLSDVPKPRPVSENTGSLRRVTDFVKAFFDP